VLTTEFFSAMVAGNRLKPKISMWMTASSKDFQFPSFLVFNFSRAVSRVPNTFSLYRGSGWFLPGRLPK
jgi:hypothetical protein